jgi:hypothetical protein
VKRTLAITRYAAGLLALAAFVLAALVHVMTLRGIDVAASYPRVWLLHYGIFVAIPITVVIVALAVAPVRGFREIVQLVPAWARVVVVLLFLYAFLNFEVVVPLSGAGTPAVRDGHYILNNHGLVQEISDSQFHAYRSLALRGFSGHWLYLYFVAAVYLLFAKVAARPRAA